ncbi:defbbdad-de92-4a2f-bd30-b3ff1a9eb277-CDS [Sclerotinia trifoliorum]|uniref:Defbbdad-de92-4a2f-bd30-b3ff1a9eb277-CDS n=1 Tax=Sclerotinia trifoliorum TaxID=28548 RepID=A0A8H2ZR99_9HELO|nr:defbbdad-de92-4a2f-bd30-b3ff1a9eb277-CDS [Sclerotinia trifoliorum]
MSTSPYNTSSSSKTKSQSQSFSSSYAESQTPSTSDSSAVQRFHSQQQLSFVVGGKSYLFPTIFGVYRDGSTKLVLSEHHITTPFMIIATSNLPDEPSIIVSSSTAVMGTVNFHDSSSKTDIVVGNTSSTLQSSGLLSPVWDFTYTFDNGRQEEFQWKRSSGEAVAGLGGRRRGSKLVRVSSGEVLAAWSQPATMNLDKVAKIGLLDSGRAHGWGERWEVTVVLGAIALIEKDRRVRDNASAAA